LFVYHPCLRNWRFLQSNFFFPSRFGCPFHEFWNWKIYLIYITVFHIVAGKKKIQSDLICFFPSEREPIIPSHENPHPIYHVPTRNATTEQGPKENNRGSSDTIMWHENVIWYMNVLWFERHDVIGLGWNFKKKILTSCISIAKWKW
jgi:hypothetical protein